MKCSVVHIHVMRFLQSTLSMILLLLAGGTALAAMQLNAPMSPLRMSSRRSCSPCQTSTLLRPLLGSATQNSFLFFLIHLMSGLGWPWALQTKVTLEPSITIMSALDREESISGGTEGANECDAIQKA